MMLNKTLVDSVRSRSSSKPAFCVSHIFKQPRGSNNSKCVTKHSIIDSPRHKLCCCVSSSISLTSEEDFVLSAARYATFICHDSSSKISNNQIRQKDDDTPVTAADLAIQSLVTKHLSDKFPDDILIAEEDITCSSSSLRDDLSLWKQVNTLCANAVKTDSEFDARSILINSKLNHGYSSNSRRFWCLDPIDGTKGFVSNANYAIGLALLPSSSSSSPNVAYPRLATLALPAERVILLSTFNNSRLYCYSTITHELTHFESKLSRPSEYENTWLLSGGSMKLKLKDMPKWTQLCCGSLVKYAAVATRKASFFVQLVPTGGQVHSWDHAAGISIITSSGGKVTDECGQKLIFDDRWPAVISLQEGSQAIVVSGDVVDHGDLCQKVREGLSHTLPV